jgi:hypothetical protein
MSKGDGKYLNEETWKALRAAGFSEEELLSDQPAGPVIFSYSRKQAVEDGVLVDLTRPGFARILKLEGVKVHTAMTATAFCAVITTTLDQAHAFEALCRLGRVLQAFRAAARLNPNSNAVHFTAPGVDDQPVKMWGHIGPGDEGEPVLTLMLEGED